MDVIDLRSDTVSHPTPEMRDALRDARIGDDVYKDDPTVNELEAYAAELLGKEAALYFPTATMSNLAATLTHCARGEEIILSKKAHIYVYEQGGASQLGGCVYHPLAVNYQGEFDLKEVTEAIRADDPHHTRTRLICLENTVHGCGGTPITAEYTDQVGLLARQHGLRLHMDGARLFNAAAALQLEPSRLVAAADSVTLCLSKGLCAPMGAILAGSQEFIARALRTRKVLGGAMRQAGIPAAAGLIGLQKMRLRLAEDHAVAQQIADGLAQIEGISVEPVHQRTNMIFFSLPDWADTQAFVAALKAQGVIIRAGGQTKRIRLVTHYWITPERAEVAVSAMRHALETQAVKA